MHRRVRSTDANSAHAIEHGRHARACSAGDAASQCGDLLQRRRKFRTRRCEFRTRRCVGLAWIGAHGGFGWSAARSRSGCCRHFCPRRGLQRESPSRPLRDHRRPRNGFRTPVYTTATAPASYLPSFSFPSRAAGRKRCAKTWQAVSDSATALTTGFVAASLTGEIVPPHSSDVCRPCACV